MIPPASSATRQHREPYISVTGRTEDVRHRGSEGYLFGKSKLRFPVFEPDHKDPWAVLGQAKFASLYDLKMEAVAQGFEAVPDSGKGAAFVMADEVTHVFKKKRLGLLCFQDADNFKKDSTARVGKAFEFSRKAKGLARKAGGQNIKIRYVVGVYGHDVLGKVAVIEQLRRHLPVVGFVGFTGKLILFTGKDTLSPEIMKRQMETAHTCEQVNEGVCCFLWLCSHG